VNATLPSLPDLANRIRTVADFYRAQNNPVQSIHIYLNDVRRLRAANPMLTRRFGFSQNHAGDWYFDGYKLIPYKGE
jgi:hypothetical protein